MYVLARSANKLIATLASAAMAASLCPVSAAFAQDAPGLSGAPAAMHEALSDAVVLEADAVTTAKSLINALPDAPKITAAAAGTYDAQIAAATAAYDALSETDQKALDTETCLTSNQPYGRVLECAQWALNALHEVDASTTLGAGTYSASTTPALSSEYSKGKSTSARQRPWSVKDVTVVDGKAYGTVTVQSDTYTYIYMAGQKFQNTAGKNQHSTFENVPIDLNSTQYLTAYSTSMQTEIVFSITTTIDESATGGSTGDNTGGSGDGDSSSESTGATQGPVNTTGNVGAVGNGNALGLTSSSNNKKASAKTAAADSDSDAAATSANAASGARSGSAAGDDGADADAATIPPLAVGGSFAGVALAGGAGFFALFRKREQH